MLSNVSILIVEDDEILAMNLVAAVEDRHCVAVGPVATVEAALASLAGTPIDAAILDAHLLDRNVTPVAMELIERAIPFVIHTGVGLPPELATVFPQVSVIMKPADPDEVVVQLLGQVARLRAPSAVGTPLQAATDGPQDLRDRQIEKVARALLDQFGDKAVILAERQAIGATGDALSAWTAIIGKLSGVARLRL